jgi:hypothetical protein
MAASVSAPVDRARNPDFVQSCNFSKLRDRLPLQWPVPPDVPPSPKRQYRSHYVYLGCDDLEEPQAWEHLSHFDVALRLIDFSRLRPVLAQRLGWTCARGHKPFDPVSMFLLQGWQIVNSWSRTNTLKNLADPRYDDYRQRFGFEKGVYPTEGGLRYFLTALGYHSDARGDTVRVELKGEPTVEVAIQYLNQLLVGAVRLLQEADLFSPKAWAEALVCPDGMLHNSPNRPQDESKARKGHGRICYGYRSLPLLLADPVHRFHATLLQDFRAANDREEVPAAALLLQLPLFYPDLHLDAVVGDAGFGFDVFLHTIYHLKARRVVDLRAHETDKDKSQWPVRGYDDKGRPVCPFGYAFTANGFDVTRQRYKWFCGKACQRENAKPVVHVQGADYPPAECPHQDVSFPYGKVLNVDERFLDGSIRLVRDVPFGSKMWKALHHRARNASEGRNATHQHWDVKRLSVYGQHRAKAFSFLTETWSTLTKLARLVREATFADTS